MDIRAILLDFDGTSLQKDQVHISPRNMKALAAAMDRGITVIPCTGRCKDMFPPQIEAEQRMRYWITASGARVIDRQTGEVLYSSLFTPGETAELCRVFEGQHLYAEISAEGKIHVEKDVNDSLASYPIPGHHLWFLAEGRQVPVETPSEYFLKNGIGMEKANIYGVPKAREQAIVAALKATGYVSVTEGIGTSIQFFPKRLRRGDAIEALMAHLGIGWENVMSLGDSALDAPMLSAAALGIAMGNASDAVKAAAADVTDSFDQDGVAKAIEKYLL